MKEATVQINTGSKDSFKSTDFGIGLGLAYDLPLGLFVNARYNLGLSDSERIPIMAMLLKIT